MSKIKSLLTINKSKDTLKGIKTIGDLKIALEQDIMKYENKVTRELETSNILTGLITGILILVICIICLYFDIQIKPY